jgi:drug/metabolite transporter (DMT)-like permease
MLNILLFITVVLIWGSTWLAVKFQVGVVAPEASVAYRMGSAAVLMFLWALWRRQSLRIAGRDHLFLLLQGALIFSTNFFMFYHAAGYLTTGLIAVIFSTASALTILFTCLLQRRPPSGRVLLGAAFGISGIAVIFWPQLAGLSWSSDIGRGILFSCGGTICFSLGSIVGARNRTIGYPLQSSMAWAMFYGTLLLSAAVLLSGSSFTFDPGFAYVSSLLYLSIIGSVLAFAAYFALLGRIEADRATYVTVLSPIVALSLSTLFEGYQWTAPGIFGVALTLIGNVLVLRKARPAAHRVIAPQIHTPRK